MKFQVSIDDITFEDARKLSLTYLASVVANEAEATMQRVIAAKEVLNATRYEQEA